MKRFAVIVFLLAPFCLIAQNRFKENIAVLRSMEDSMVPYAKAMIFADDAAARFRADSILSNAS